MDDHNELRALLTRAADDVGVLHPPSVDLIAHRYQRRRLVVSVLAPACAALIVLAIALVFVVRGSRSAAPAVHRTDVDQLKTFHWSTTPASPLAARSGSAVAWTGSELILWGGQAPPHYYPDGAAYDPATDKWSLLPPSPLSARAVPLSVWTGSELFVWGGSDGRAGHLTDGALYDPATKKWHRVPHAPLRGDYLNGGAYRLGSKVLLLTVLHRPTDLGRSAYRTVDAALYDPATNTWQREPTLHVQAHQPVESMLGVSTGAGVVVQFAWQHRDTAVGYTFDAASSKWVRNKLTLPPRSYTQNVLWTGSRVLQVPIYPFCRSCVAVGETGGFSVDPVTGKSTKIAKGPLDETDPVYVWTKGALLGVAADVPEGNPAAGDRGATYAWDPTENTWTALRSATRLPGADSLDSRSGVWTGSSLLIWTDSNYPGHLRVLRFGPK